MSPIAWARPMPRSRPCAIRSIGSARRIDRSSATLIAGRAQETDMAQIAEGRRNADRIKSIARNRHMNVQEALKRFALERLLYRLSANDDAHRWLLKGGALFWLDDDGEGASGIRPTSDIDLHRSEEHTSELQSLMRNP